MGVPGTPPEDLSQEDLGRLESIADSLSVKHGSRIRAAFDWYRSDEDDWKSFARQVYYDQIGDAWILEARITKHNGEVTTIRSNASSMISLADFLIRTVNIIPEGSGVDSAKAVKKLLATAEELRSRSETWHATDD
jgi:hypothetical protein